MLRSYAPPASSVKGLALQTHLLSLVLGGARSGKSQYAEALVTAWPPCWTYIATAQAFDDEMRDRIALHRERRAQGWITVESPLELPAAIVASDGPVLVDCLTLWLTNLMLGEHDIEAAVTALETSLIAARTPVVMVSNEVGLGIVPDNALARAFRDQAGLLNQRIAAHAQHVVFMAAGLPMILKGSA